MLTIGHDYEGIVLTYFYPKLSLRESSGIKDYPRHYEIIVLEMFQDTPEIVHGDELEFKALGFKHRVGEPSFKYLLRGQDGTPENYMLALALQRHSILQYTSTILINSDSHTKVTSLFLLP